MGRKRSTCLYLDAEVVGTARKLGLNVSKVSENAMKEAIERLSGTKQEDSLRSKPDMRVRTKALT